MPKKVDRDNPSGPLTDFDAASLDQVKNGKVLIELADGSDHVLGTVEQIISGLVKLEVETLLRNKTADLIYDGNESWNTAAGNDNISVLRGGIGEPEVNAIADWAAVYTIPSGTETTGSIVVRLEIGANPNDYRIVAGNTIFNVGDLPQIRAITSDTYDYYGTGVGLTGDFAVGEDITLQHHGAEGHTRYVGGSPLVEAEIEDVRDDVAGKADARPFDAFIDRNYYVRTNREALTYHLQLHNIVPALLPDVDTVVVLMRGSPVHNASFDPTASTDQVVPIELSTSEATNIATNVRDDTTIAIELSFRNGSTQVLRETIQIPVVTAPPRREKREILNFNIVRSASENATLPTDYSEWEFCKILIREGNNSDTILIGTDDLSEGDLDNYGRGTLRIDWILSTRIISTQDDNGRLIKVVLI